MIKINNMHFVLFCILFFIKYTFYLDPNASRSESAVSFCIILVLFSTKMKRKSLKIVVPNFNLSRV